MGGIYKVKVLVIRKCVRLHLNVEEPTATDDGEVPSLVADSLVSDFAPLLLRPQVEETCIQDDIRVRVSPSARVDVVNSGRDCVRRGKVMRYLGTSQSVFRLQLFPRMGDNPGPFRELIRGFGRYKNTVQSLDILEVMKLQVVADKIARSFEPGEFPVVGVRIIGHADFDAQRGRAFELSISKERALNVEQWLTSPLTTAELVKQIKTVKGAGDYAAENLLKLLGRYDGLALDSWTRAKFFKVRNNGRKASDKKIARYYSRFREWRGLALWCDMTRDWIDGENAI